MLKAALYARVSSEEQAKRENSIPAQLRALREYCRKNNIEIFKEYKDEGITGQISKRPAFQQMLSAAFSGKINVILIINLTASLVRWNCPALLKTACKPPR